MCACVHASLARHQQPTLTSLANIFGRIMTNSIFSTQIPGSMWQRSDITLLDKNMYFASENDQIVSVHILQILFQTNCFKFEMICHTQIFKSGLKVRITSCPVSLCV